MKNITNEELKIILEKHSKWLKGAEDGERANLIEADLRGADLTEADLRGANLTEANLTEANLIEANLRLANLIEADLRGADLRWAFLTKANLTKADLRKANLTEANLTKANLTEADLRWAFLTKANLTKADLRWANLTEANLTEADLRLANLTKDNLTKANLTEAKNSPYIPMYCPCEGSFIGWKKAILKTFTEGLIKLEILEDSLRSSATSEKCRCNKARVLKITSLDEKHEYDEAFSYYDTNFIYKVGEIVSVDNFCEDRFDECAAGIHFFINKQTAIDYIL